ncbi:hypothetical protein GCM10029978_067130 [Actinoallomurus acanthiterrae]
MQPINDDFLLHARELADRLGSGWQAHPTAIDPRGSELTHPDGRCLFVGFTSPDTPMQLVIRGIFPDSDHDRPPGHRTPQITIAFNRGPTVWAAEIRRRLLPAYGAQLDRVRDYHAVCEQHHADREAVAAQILERLPGSWRFDSNTGRLRLHWNPPWKAGSTRITVSADATHVDMDLDWVPRHVADAVITVLADVDRKHR